jgi:flagellin-like protein
MNTSKLGMKNRRKAVTPVIATIILIAGTLVLALVVGAYTFGLFGSNVKTITLSSATLYGGSTYSGGTATSSLSIALNNPGSLTEISSLTLTGTGLAAAITSWCVNSLAGTGGTTCAGAQNPIVFGTPATDFNNVTAGAVSSLTFYPKTGAAVTLNTGQTFNYVISFVNGQSVSGSLIAQ